MGKPRIQVSQKRIEPIGAVRANWANKMQDGYDSEFEHHDGLVWQESRYGLGLIGRTAASSDADELNQFTDDEFEEDERLDPRAYSQMSEDELSSDEDEPVSFDFNEDNERVAQPNMDVPDGFVTLTNRVCDQKIVLQKAALLNIRESFEYPR